MRNQDRAKKLRAALEDARSVIAFCGTQRLDRRLPEDFAIQHLEPYGWGAIMQACSRRWARVFDGTPQEGAQYTVGPCEETVRRALDDIDAVLAETAPEKETTR